MVKKKIGLKFNWHRLETKLKSYRDNPRFQKAMLPLFLSFGAIVVALTVLSILLLPKANSDSQRGIGADGFHAYIEKDGDLGVLAITTQDAVSAALDGKAKGVKEPEVSQVFNLNGDRSQTLTFPFTRADGVKANLYIDKKQYKSQQSLDNDHIYVATAKAGLIGGLPAYYRHAQSIDSDREYHIMVVDGLTAYRFVIAQPEMNIKISEIDAAAILKKLAMQSKL